LNSKTLIIAFAAVMAVAAATSIYVSRTVDRVEKTITAVAAPDGRYKAVILRLSQGGKAPFCYESVSIYLSVYPDNFAESEKGYQVYWSPCATPANATDAPAVTWLANDKAQITYTPGPPPADPTRLRKRVVDASRYVTVSYVARK
jgi:hypothetical protein